MGNFNGGRGEWRNVFAQGKFNWSVSRPPQKKKKSNAGVFNSNCLDSNGKPTAAFQVILDNVGYSNGKSSTRQCQQRGGSSACPSVSLTGLGILFPPVFSRFLLIAQSVSMRLMLYVRLYTNYHIRRRESTFTLPNKAATPHPQPLHRRHNTQRR